MKVTQKSTVKSCHADFKSMPSPLMLGKIEGRRRSGYWRMRRLDGIIQLSAHEFERRQALGDSVGQGSWQDVVHGVTRVM